MGVRCFVLEPTTRVEVWLRRYRSGGDNDKCPGPPSFHNARVHVGNRERPMDADGHETLTSDLEIELVTDPRWPTLCQACAMPFDDRDPHQVFTERIYRRTDSGDEMTIAAAPPGAMYDAHWLHAFCVGPDGRSLIIKCPGGELWHVDDVASNCSWKGLPRPKNTHCWQRTGEVPLITVARHSCTNAGPNGSPCGVGGGSIQTPSWHGYLTNGELYE